MCYHVSTPEEEAIHDFLPNYGIIDYRHYFHASTFSKPQVPVILNTGIQEVVPVRWGRYLINKNPKTGKLQETYTANAKSENLFKSKAWSDSIKNRRCLFIVNGFYENQHPTKALTVPYYIYMPDQKPFMMAGIWKDDVNKETGEVIRTGVIVTTEANKLLREIHNTAKRMPLILDESQWDEWLYNDGSYEKINPLCVPYKDDILRAHRISNLYYQRGVDTNIPGVHQPIE